MSFFWQVYQLPCLLFIGIGYASICILLHALKCCHYCSLPNRSIACPGEGGHRADAERTGEFAERSAQTVAWIYLR